MSETVDLTEGDDPAAVDLNAKQVAAGFEDTPVMGELVSEMGDPTTDCSSLTYADVVKMAAEASSKSEVTA
jgi:hypothetical protein